MASIFSTIKLSFLFGWVNLKQELGEKRSVLGEGTGKLDSLDVLSTLDLRLI
jgi:hypothetical protein